MWKPKACSASAITLEILPLIFQSYHDLEAEDKENLSRGHGEDRESWTRGKTC